MGPLSSEKARPAPSVSLRLHCQVADTLPELLFIKPPRRRSQASERALLSYISLDSWGRKGGIRWGWNWGHPPFPPHADAFPWGHPSGWGVSSSLQTQPAPFVKHTLPPAFMYYPADLLMGPLAPVSLSTYRLECPLAPLQ